MRKHPAKHAGQSIVEYALILSVVAIVALPSFVLLRDTQAGFFNAHASNLNAPSMYTEPKSADDCKNDGWKTFYTSAGSFKNQGDCVSWLATDGKNAPAGSDDDKDKGGEEDEEDDDDNGGKKGKD
jgi:Flp pilus assembly pilin Flp